MDYIHHLIRSQTPEDFARKVRCGCVELRCEVIWKPEPSVVVSVNWREGVFLTSLRLFKDRAELIQEDGIAKYHRTLPVAQKIVEKARKKAIEWAQKVLRRELECFEKPSRAF